MSLRAILTAGAACFLSTSAAMAGNTAIIDQSGVFNGAFTAQRGQNNTAVTYQTGVVNSATTAQFGRNNAAGISQSGVFNGAAVFQNAPRPRFMP